MIRVKLTDPQYELVTTGAPFPAFVGGFGSGKTYALIARALALKAKYWRLNVAYYLPTYDLVRRIAFPRFCEVLDTWGVAYTLNRQDNVITFQDGGEIIFRTMDRPERIVGYEVADSCVDELDTLKAQDAEDVWNKIIARNRQKKPDGAPNTVAVGTTPEGFRFVYDRWKRDPRPGYQLIQAPTSSNAHNLPDGYIDSLRSAYPTALLQAYLEGEFVNLTAGSVYPEFSRQKNATFETIQAGEVLHVGMDFNVNNMAAAISVERNGQPLTLAELTGVRDTPAMCDLLKQRFPGHRIIVYPDASGRSRRSVNASESDISILRAAGFTVRVNPTNPAVKDRVLAVNAVIHKDGERRWRINPDTCPELVMALEQQAYDKNGEPDKSTGFDHINDAAGYYIVQRFPVQRRMASVRPVTGLI